MARVTMNGDVLRKQMRHGIIGEWSFRVQEGLGGGLCQY